MSLTATPPDKPDERPNATATATPDRPSPSMAAARPPTDVPDELLPSDDLTVEQRSATVLEWQTP